MACSEAPQTSDQHSFFFISIIFFLLVQPTCSKGDETPLCDYREKEKEKKEKQKERAEEKRREKKKLSIESYQIV